MRPRETIPVEPTLWALTRVAGKTGHQWADSPSQFLPRATTPTAPSSRALSLPLAPPPQLSLPTPSPSQLLPWGCPFSPAFFPPLCPATHLTTPTLSSLDRRLGHTNQESCPAWPSRARAGRHASPWQPGAGRASGGVCGNPRTLRRRTCSAAPPRSSLSRVDLSLEGKREGRGWLRFSTATKSGGRRRGARLRAGLED